MQLRPKQDTNPTLTIKNLTIDVASRTVKKENEEIALTQKEFDLLVMLVKNKNNVCTRTEIIEQVWDIHFEYNTGVIDVYINSLRKKLTLTEENNFIQTIRGIGYLAKEE